MKSASAIILVFTLLYGYDPAIARQIIRGTRINDNNLSSISTYFTTGLSIANSPGTFTSASSTANRLSTFTSASSTGNRPGTFTTASSTGNHPGTFTSVSSTANRSRRIENTAGYTDFGCLANLLTIPAPPYAANGSRVYAGQPFIPDLCQVNSQLSVHLGRMQAIPDQPLHQYHVVFPHHHFW